jgi:arrestin-related trafficking adapter 4/5/7
LNLKDFGVRANVKWHRWHDQIHIPHLESAPCIKGILESEGSSLPSARMTLLAGTYKWPFEFIIPRSMVESVEGLANAHIKYKLQATVIQATVTRGRLSHDFHAFKPVCIIRTLDPSALANAMLVKNLWLNKVEYSIIVSQ